MTEAEKIEAVEHALDGRTELVAKAREVAWGYVWEYETGWERGLDLSELAALGRKLDGMEKVLGRAFIDRIMEEERVRAALSSAADEDVSYRAEYTEKFYGVNP